MNTKRAADVYASRATGVPLREVSAITALFLRAMRRALLQGDTFPLEGIGRLRLHLRRGPSTTKQGADTVRVPRQAKYYVTVRKTRAFSLALKEADIMDKFGVDESQTTQTKQAQQGCPSCGAKPERHGRVLLCPKHGSEPFEQKK